MMWGRWVMWLGVIWVFGAASTFFVTQLVGDDHLTRAEVWAIVAGGFGYVAAVGVIAAIVAMIRRRMDDFGGGQLAASSGSSTTKLELSDLHGDVVSEVPNTTNAAATLRSPVDAFGAPTSSAGANVGSGFLGAMQRNTALTSGTVEMGRRLYQPQIGRFLQPDPIYGGSLNPYDYANQDPSNAMDPSGESAGKWICTVLGCIWVGLAGLPGSHLPRPPNKPGAGRPDPGLPIPGRGPRGGKRPRPDGDGDDPEDRPGDPDRPSGGNGGKPHSSSKPQSQYAA